MTNLALTEPTRTTSRAPERETTLDVRGLTKSFPVRRGWGELIRHPWGGERVLAVENLTFQVQQGEFFGLLGPNGAGKTTIFKMLSTLILPDAGSATIVGHDLVRSPARVREVLNPVIADERSLSWRISARENLRFYATLYGLRGREETDAVNELLELVGLAETGHKIVGAFSSGMKQRLLLARSLLSRPRILLLDEPTRSLDPIAAHQFRKFLSEEIVGNRGCTVLLATHNSEEALELCDRVIVLDRGRSVATGAPQELISSFGEERYQVWTRTPEHPAFERSGMMRVISTLNRESPDGWVVLEMAISGGEDGSAVVLEELIQSGARIGRFEKIRVPLANLIEGLMKQENGHAG